jgi:two-component system nitrogen regulation response regulator GlnG
MAPSQVIEPKDLPPEVQSSSGHTSSGHFYRTELTQQLAIPPEQKTAASPEQTNVVHPAQINAVRPEQINPVRPELVEGSSHSVQLEQSEREAVAHEVVSGMSTTHNDNWEQGMYKVALELLATQRTDVWDEMTRRFESLLIQAALAHCKGRRIDAANKLGIGRNTITRKIQELGLDKGVGKD